MYTGFWWGNLSEREYLEDPGVDGKIIFRWIFGKWDVVAWTGRSFVVLLTSFVYKRPSRRAQYRAVCTAETLYSMHFTSPKSPLHLKLLFGVFVAQEVGP